MRCKGIWIVSGVLLAAPVLLAQTASPAAPTGAPTAVPSATPTSAAPPVTHHKSHNKPQPAPMVLPPLPSGPLRQLPMDQIPATPAKVSYQGGLLTISAQNSTLGEILRDVRRLTGASIEFPSGPNGASERVVTHIGPGSPRDVLVSLLNGSSFNYVMLGSNSDPAAVSSVILTPKETLSNETQTANVYQGAPNSSPGTMPLSRFPGPRAFNPQAVTPMAGNGVAEPAEGDDAKDDDQEAADEPAAADDQAQPGQQVQPDATAAAQAGQSDPNQPNAGPKTPEQILEMLRHPQQPGGAVVPAPAQPPQQ
jgi:hypothetical protein